MARGGVDDEAVQFGLHPDLARQAGIRADIEGEVLKTLTEQLDVKWASLFLHNPDTNRLYVHTAYGDQKILAPERLALSVPPPIMANTSPIWQELTQTRQPILVEDTSNDPRLINRARLANVAALSGG